MKTDFEIQKDVMEELRWEPLLKASEIGVAVKNGVVTLSGLVDTYAKKRVAEEAAKRVLGVKAVAEDIVVKLTEFGKRTDSEIAQAVVNALKWHSAIEEDQIKVKVENGWVTLEGMVNWEFQKKAARRAVEDLIGVIGIYNKITVVPLVVKLDKPVVEPTDLKRKINAALHRSATVDAEKIKLEVIGNKVILSGKVRSLAEKQDAEDAVWYAPGVTKVENNLKIESEIFAL